MERESLDHIKDGLEKYVQAITTKGRGAFYICPICHSGTGHNKTAAFSITQDGRHWTCFACNALADKGRDIFDLIGIVENIPDFQGQLKRAKEFFGLPEDKYQYQYKIERKEEKPPEVKRPEVDYTTFFNDAYSHIKETDYPARRGLTQETIDRFMLGYVAEWKNPAAEKAPASPRLIIPTSSYSYLARDTREKVPAAAEEYTKIKVGELHILNAAALSTANKPIFITEGEINALSILQEGGEAIAIGSTQGTGIFLRYLKERGKPSQPLLLAMDKDNAGNKAMDELGVGLQELQIPCYNAQEIAGPYNDANEHLVKDKEGFRKALAELENMPYKLMEEQKKAELDKYMEEKAALYDIEDFWTGIFKVDTPFIPTGFKTLDEQMDGGLYEGLHIIGSISSAGKTTFTLQLADQMAAQGTDVIIFSLEMAKYELMAKSISRLTYNVVRDRGSNLRNAKTTRRITTRKFWENYSQLEKEIIEKALGRYYQFAGHIFIVDGLGDITVGEIKEQVEKHISITGRKPVVIVDYLQILQPYDMKATDKQNTDKAVLELKRLSRDNKLTVIAISSFNRASYRGEAVESAFKESGAIEYSSDVLLGLQFKGAAEKKFSIRKAKAKKVRDMELLILKNRNGQTGRKIAYKYYTLFNVFEDYGLVTETAEADTPGADAEGILPEEQGNWTEITGSFE